MATDCWNLWKNYFGLKWLKWLSCHTACWIGNLISFILLKEIWHCAIQTGRVNRKQRAVTTFFMLSVLMTKSPFFPRYSVFLSMWQWCRLIHSAVCLTTGPKPLPKRALYIVRSRTSSFKWEYPLLFLKSSSSFLRLLPRLSVTSIPHFYLSFNNLLQKAVSTQNVTNPVRLPFSYFM